MMNEGSRVWLGQIKSPRKTSFEIEAQENKNVFNTFNDKNARDIMYRLIHEDLPVNYLMYNRNTLYI